MPRSTAERFRQALENLADRLRSDTAAIVDETLRASGGQGDGELSNVPMHLADMGTAEFDHDLSAAVLENEEYLSGEVHAALKRIDDGTFGDCEACGESIPRARLEAIPYARYCVRCATAQQGKHRVNVNTGRPNGPDVLLSTRGDLQDDRSDRRQTGLTDVDARRTRRMNRGDSHAVGEAGGGTASGGIAGSNYGDGEPDTADLADAMGSSDFDARSDDELTEFESDAVAAPVSRQQRMPERD